MNSLERMVVSAEGLWAKYTVKLAPEPPGERSGRVGDELGQPLTLVAVGDSMVAGCGVEAQEQGLVPRIAWQLESSLDTPITWSAHGKLGATMRRVRYRLLPEVSEQDEAPDVLLVCAGSNDVMGSRTGKDWYDDLSAVLDQSLEITDAVVLCSSGQPHNSPALPRMLRRAIEDRVDRQTEMSADICAGRGIPFTNVTHIDLVPQFWATDHFHPGPLGYKQAAEIISEAMVPLVQQAA